MASKKIQLNLYLMVAAVLIAVFMLGLVLYLKSQQPENTPDTNQTSYGSDDEPSVADDVVSPAADSAP